MCRLSVTSLCILLSFPAIGQETDTQDNVPDPEVIDEITVYGEDDKDRSIQAEIVRADLRMYTLYNEMNPDDEFDVHCRLEKLWGSNRRKRICQPVFETGVMDEVWNDLSTYTAPTIPQAVLREKREILRKKMIEYAGQNPALADAIVKRANLQRQLQESESDESE